MVNYYLGLLEGYIDNTSFIYILKENGFLNFMGIRGGDFYSSDYFPIFPWVFLFFSGGILGKVFLKSRREERHDEVEFRVLKFLGRHSLIIYLVHIPVILIYPIYILLKIY